MIAPAALRRTRANAANILRYPLQQQAAYRHPTHTDFTRVLKSPGSDSSSARTALPLDPLASVLSQDQYRPTPVRTHTLPRPLTFWPRAPHSLILFRRRDAELPSAIECALDIPGAGHQSPMLQYVQVISVPAADSPGACVLLHFDNRRYVFGHVAEGTQRVTSQRKISLSKVDEIFLSGPVSWKNAGGLLGMVLTIADLVTQQNLPNPNESSKKRKMKADKNTSTIPSLKIYGGENITHLVATSRRFIFRKGMPLRLHEVLHDSVKDHQKERKPDFEDANVRVWYVSLKPQEDATPKGRKRSHDDMVAEDGSQLRPSRDAETAQIGRELVKSVVDHMFDSNWQLDALMETTLHHVQLPAAIFVKDKDGKIQKYEGPMPGGDSPAPDIPVLTRTPWPAARVRELPHTSPSKQSLCYIVKGQPRRGRFNPERAVELGVQKWDFKKLTAGETVKGKDDVDVTPEMVIGETVEGRGFAFIDLPDKSYIDEFLARSEWNDDSLMSTVDIMYWNLGRDVGADQRIKDFMKKRGDRTHSVFGPDVNPNEIVFQGATASLIKMHRIDPDRFPLPVFDNKSKVARADPFEMARMGLKVTQSPRVEVHSDELVQHMDMMEPVHAINRKVLAMADRAKKESSDPAFLAEIEASEKDIPNRDVEVIALGTGSALPSKYRNVSGTLVRVPGYGSYLFDCGENTLGQIRRMYGFEKAEDILSDLKVIWISHLHADHHLGTASVIGAWNEATRSRTVGGALPRLAVVSHEHMNDWLREYADVEDFGFDRVIPINIRGNARSETVQTPFVVRPASNMARETGLTRIDSCRVDHCYGALACVFTWPTGLKIAYSGDCRPSVTFARIGKGCTLLIHESTLDDELQSDAHAKKHCTMTEALTVARKMQARRVLLTHFSQRYPKIGNSFTTNPGEEANDQVVLAAFDMMRVKLGDFKKAEKFLPALRMMLEESHDDDDDDS